MDYFSADFHFGHENIIAYTSRPFKNVKEMNAILIKNFNECVKSGDTIYILGDVSTWYNIEPKDIERLVRKLHGRKILILGNHDKFPVFDYVEMGFESVHTYFYHERLGVHLIHDPAPACGPKNMLWLCGHVHGLFKETRNVLNVGVDVWDFKPVSEDIIKEWIIKKKGDL
jgi:calcineurin-like phosphoesterase family protein